MLQALPSLRYTQPLVGASPHKAPALAPSKNLPRDPRPLAPSQFSTLDTDAATVRLSLATARIARFEGDENPESAAFFVYNTITDLILPSSSSNHSLAAPLFRTIHTRERARKVRAPSHSIRARCTQDVENNHYLNHLTSPQTSLSHLPTPLIHTNRGQSSSLATSDKSAGIEQRTRECHTHTKRYLRLAPQARFASSSGPHRLLQGVPRTFRASRHARAQLQ